MGFVLAFVIGYLALCTGVAYGLTKALRRLAPRLRVGWTVLALVLVSLAFTPIPIHGGVTFLLPQLVAEGWRELRQQRERAEVVESTAHLDARFAGFLPEADRRGRERDAMSGLVWSARVGTVRDISPESLDAGRTACAALTPLGYWAVPRTTEYYFLARAGRLEGAWLAETFVMPGEIAIVSLARGPVGRSTTDGIGVRCVAVTPPAPRRGYLVSDIGADEWNRYQLGVLNAEAVPK